MDHLNRYENKSIFYTRVSLVGNICWVGLKLILGFLVSYVFLASALFQIFIVISKAYLYFNIKKRDYAKTIDYHFVGIITLFASILYGFYFLSIRDNLKSYEMNVAILFAIAAFVEIGVSLFGIFKTKKRCSFVSHFKTFKLFSCFNLPCFMSKSNLLICGYCR